MLARISHWLSIKDAAVQRVGLDSVVSGHGFSRAAPRITVWALAPAFGGQLPGCQQGLKPFFLRPSAARLKPCPDTNQTRAPLGLNR